MQPGINETSWPTIYKIYFLQTKESIAEKGAAGQAGSGRPDGAHGFIIVIITTNSWPLRGHNQVATSWHSVHSPVGAACL